MKRILDMFFISLFNYPIWSGEYGEGIYNPIYRYICPKHGLFESEVKTTIVNNGHVFIVECEECSFQYPIRLRGRKWREYQNESPILSK